MACLFLIFPFLLISLAKANLLVENLRASMHPFGDLTARNGGVRFKMESPAKQIWGMGHQMTEGPDQRRREKIAKEQAKVDFINKNSNGLWKASLFLPFALMEDERKEMMLYGTIPTNKEEAAASFNATYVNMLLEKIKCKKMMFKKHKNSHHRRDRRNAENANEEFDARKMWPQCAKIIGEITMQWDCSSCWAEASSAVLSDRICIWRLKKFEALLAKWEYAVEKGKNIGKKMADWNYFGEFVEQIWAISKMIFVASNFKEAEENELAANEKAELKENCGNYRIGFKNINLNKNHIWYKLLMNNWVEKNSLQLKNIKEKMETFERWHREMNVDEGMKMEMRNQWCQNVHLHRLLIRDEFALLKGIVGNEYKKTLENYWAGQKGENHLEMAEIEILDKFVSEWDHSSEGPTEEEFICLLQEIRAGQWNVELGLGYPAVKLAKEKKMKIAQTHLGHWLNLEEIDEAEWPQWKAEMREMFKEEANKPKNVVSAFHMLTCAHKDQENKCEDGTTLNAAFEYAQTRGMVSGLNSNLGGPHSGCKPYKITPSFNLESKNSLNLDCQEKCSNLPWGNEMPGKIGINNLIWLPREVLIKMGIGEAEIEAMIMAEIRENGPVAAILRANSIIYYKEGIYSRTNQILTKDQEDKINTDPQRLEWVHAIRLIGWGVENGVKYWIAANSWGKQWGENGFVRIIRGQNEVGIEEEIVFPTMNY